jgi:predicted O-methyltransferase YrrM
LSQVADPWAAVPPRAAPAQWEGRFLKLDDALYRYVLAHSLREHPEQAALRQATQLYPHASMQISPEQGQFMALLVQLTGARQAIEVGVFTGYSALSVALAMPEDGRLLACEIDEEPTRLARPFWERAGVAHKIDLRIAPATTTLDASIAAGQAGTYDFAFIDADKLSYDVYYERCLTLLRPGGLAVIDNTLRRGEVVAASVRPDTLALQALNRKVHQDARVDMVLLPFSDGVTLARKR